MMGMALGFVAAPSHAACPPLEHEGYRVWVGPNRKVDWIDVCCRYQPMPDGQFRLDYKDDSEITEIRSVEGLDERFGCNYEIDKNESQWLLFSKTGKPEDYQLILVIADIEIRP